ncbi:hypothetical protein [Arenicella xantha]|uniref:Uncharacterized protein n=1 Tax=Arenicella xantha TaxID=644221 RepID=A0A395JL80_9GAMM|nr:hypothetical protein [Arenicella xantha]RBP51185.1 hypothetical protein DFR28_102604 [Arenicella xantha]
MSRALLKWGGEKVVLFKYVGTRTRFVGVCLLMLGSGLFAHSNACAGELLGFYDYVRTKDSDATSSSVLLHQAMDAGLGARCSELYASLSCFDSALADKPAVAKTQQYSISVESNIQSLDEPEFFLQEHTVASLCKSPDIGLVSLPAVLSLPEQAIEDGQWPTRNTVALFESWRQS